MRCAKCQKLYDAAVQGLLSESLNRKVRDHLAACPACAVVWQENEALRGLIRQTAEPPRLPDAAYFARLAKQAMVASQNEAAGTSPARSRSSLFEALSGLLTGLRFGVAGLARAAALLIVGLAVGLAVSPYLRNKVRDQVLPTRIEVADANLRPSISPGLSPALGPILPPDSLASESGGGPNVFKVEPAARPPVDPTLFVETWQGIIALLDKMPPSDEVERLRRIQRVSREVPVTALVTRLQDLKLQLAQSGQRDYIRDVQRMEEILGQLMAISGETQPADAAHLETYLKAAEAHFEKRYNDALRLYNMVTIQARGTYLAACATNKMGDINFEYFRNYGNAFIEYNSCLNKPLRDFLSEAVLKKVEERVAQIADNSVDNYAPLDLFYRAEATTQPASAAELYSTLLKKYPGSGLVQRALAALTRLTRQAADDTSLVTQVLDALDQFLNQDANHPRGLDAQLAVADITNFCVRNRQQAVLEYTKILEKAKDAEMIRTVQARLRSLEKGR